MSTPASIDLAPVDRVEVLTILDNVMDMLLPNTAVAKRMHVAGRKGQRLPEVEAPLVESGRAADYPTAQHGLSFLVSATADGERGSVLLDTGATVDGLAHNMRALGVDALAIEAIVLSHGHFDHTMGLNGLSLPRDALPPLLVHPDAWLKRRVAVPGQQPRELTTTARDRVAAAGFRIVERTGPSLILGDRLLVSGEIERVTPFEQGFGAHQALRDGEWVPDPLIRDDQALVANVRGRGLVVITGCGHAGVVNSVRYAQKLTGVERVYAVIGGFHLATSSLESVVAPTVEALLEVAPEVIVPAHCTGWRATHAIAAAFPDAFVQGSVGTNYVLERPDMPTG